MPGRTTRDGANTQGTISDARDSLDGKSDDDQGIVDKRSAGSVLNIVYLNPAKVTKGGFFPKGVNGEINTSDANT